MKLAKSAAVFVIGGVSFWAPTVLIELITKRELSAVVGTTIPLGTVLLAYFVISRARQALWTRWASISMLVGVYVLGPLMMSIGWTYLGGSGLKVHDLGNLALASLIPLITLYMAGPDGTLFAVLLATGALILIHFGFERRR